MGNDIFLAILAGLLGAGGILGSKGLLDRFVMGRQQQEASMSGAVVKMSQDLINSTVGILQDIIKANNASILQLSQNLEAFKMDSSHQYRFLREKVEGNTERLDRLDGHIIEMNQRLNVIVEHLANRHE